MRAALIESASRGVVSGIVLMIVTRFRAAEYVMAANPAMYWSCFAAFMSDTHSSICAWTLGGA